MEQKKKWFCNWYFRHNDKQWKIFTINVLLGLKESNNESKAPRKYEITKAYP